MILAVGHIRKEFPEKVVLSDVSFHIEAHEKAAIVGVNGAGKSTLLKIICGEMTPEEGQVTLQKDISLGYLAQHQEMTGELTILETMLSARGELLELEQKLRELEHKMKEVSGDELEAVMAAYTRVDHAFESGGGYAYQSEVTGILKGLGFAEEDFNRQTRTLSGGQRMRVALGRLLLIKPDLLLLDEPTNHLDLNSILWLEDYLRSYEGSVLIVSHDRYFLDRVVTKIIDIDHTHCNVYNCNYTEFVTRKKQMLEVQMHQYENQQAMIRHQEQVIEKLRSFNREKSIKRAESREKMLNKIEVLDKPVTDDDTMTIHLNPAVVSGNDVLTVRGLSKSYGSLNLFSDLDIDIRRGERVALIGDNGTGKTTILRILNGLETPDSGKIVLGAKVEVAYYDQEHHVLHNEKTLFDELSDTYPGMNNTQIRNVLAAFLFTGDDVFKRIGDLSGGERGRVSLAKLMLTNANLLILDEPTNHLDILSKEILEDALLSYTGTVFYVSHDRYFINKTATRILDLTGHAVKNYLGNYDYYLEKKAQAALAASAAANSALSSSAGSSSDSEGKLSYEAEKRRQAALRKQKNDLARCEARIEELEIKNREIDELLTQEEVFTNVARLMELQKEKQAAEDELATLYETWEELSASLEE